MSQYKISKELGVIHFLTLTVINWLDVFTKPEYFQIIIDSLKYCQKKKGLLIHAYVIITNHLHLMVSVRGGNIQQVDLLHNLRCEEAPARCEEAPASEQESLSDIMRDFKSWTAKEIYKQLLHDNRNYIPEILELNKSNKNKDFQLWQQWIITCDGTSGANNLEAFYNGASKGNATLVDSAITMKRIGDVGDGSSGIMDGQIGGVKIWNRVLSADEIDSLHNKEKKAF